MIDGVKWGDNPLIALPAWVWGVVDLWQLCRAFGGPFGGRVLPTAGSVGDQSAALLDAFALLDGIKDAAN